MKISKSEKITYDIFNLKGNKTSKQSLVVPVSNLENQLKILAQTIRVHLTNQRQGTVSTKTRGEVEGSTKKIYKQKGTGRARHGDIKAPIFIGGGVIFGPRPRNFNLKLPEKVAKKAFLLSLVDKLKNNQLTVVTGLDELPAKTSAFFNLLKALFVKEIKKSKFLFINDNKNAFLASRNIKNVTVVPVSTLNTYEMLSHQKILIDKKTFEKLILRVGLKIPVKRKIS